MELYFKGEKIHIFFKIYFPSIFLKNILLTIWNINTYTAIMQKNVCLKIYPYMYANTFTQGAHYSPFALS